MNYNPNFYCPITGDVMSDPVIDRDGITYERVAIEEWIHRRATSPTTRAPMALTDLTPNRSLREAIDEEKRRLGAQQTLHTAPVIGDTAAERVVSPMIPIDYQIELSCRPITPEESIKMVMPAATDSDEESFLLHASILAPDVEGLDDGHIPTDIVLIIDISGSMNNDAPPPKGKQAHESANLSLSLLDLVKHATNTVIETLTEYDRLALISFSNSAQIVFDFTVMTDVGKRLASSRLKSLEADGMTNLWDGLFKGLELLKARFDPTQPTLNAGLAQRNSTILLLTDGEPNIEPPRGILPMLKRYTDRPENKFQGIINTFGFGYSLHSHLLRDIAIQGNGMYAFIPDSGFVGTAFVNALANTLSTVITDAELTVVPSDGVRIFPLEGLINTVRPITLPASSPKQMKVPVGTIQMGQSIDRLFYMTIKKSLLLNSTGSTTGILTMTLNRASARGVAFGSSQQTQLTQNIISNYFQISQSEDEVDKLQYQFVRYKAIKTIQTVYENMKMSKKEDAIILVDTFVSEMNELTSGNLSYTLSVPQQRVKDLTRDFSGQISEAVSREEWWRKWGIHYLPSLQRAHELQQCNNFKDPGIQAYGGELFNNIRDIADDIFCRLPPPTRSVRPVAVVDQTLLQPQTVPLQLPGTLTPQASFNNIGTPRAPPVPYPAAATTVPDQGLMASYNDRDAGCLLGTCKVQLKNGSIVMVENLIKGDIVCTGISPKTYGRVKCIVRNQVVTGKLEVVRLSDHCVLTPWHPVRSLRASISATTTATNITTATARSTLESDNIHSNDNKWKFPIDLNSSETILCQYVYSLLIDSMHTTDEVNSSDIFISHRYNTTTINNMKNSKYATGIIVDGIYEAIALAHGIKNDDVAEHEFFGTTNIVSAISVLPGYDDGVVTILPGWMTRDSVTDRVVGIDAKMVSVEDKMVVDMSDDDVDDLMM